MSSERTKTTRREILSIAVPAVAGMAGNIFFDIANVFWVGGLGARAVAAVGVSGFLAWAVYALMNVSAAGCQTLIARARGAGDRAEAWAVGREAVWLSVFWGAAIMVLLWVVSPTIFRLMGLDAESQRLANEYFFLWVFALPLIYAFYLSGQIFNAWGDTRTSMKILGATLALNMVFDPILIYGFGPVPAMGVRGAALAVMFSEVFGVVARFSSLRRKEFLPPWRDFLPSRLWSVSRWRTMLGIGVPQAATSLTWSLVYPMMSAIITRFGMEPLAAVTVGQRIESIMYITAAGFSIAMATLVGQAVGARDEARLREVLHETLRLGSALILPVAIICVIWAEWLVSWITTDPLVARHAADYLRVTSYFEVFILWEVGMQGAFNGIGNSRPYMFLCVPLSLSRVPLSWLFAVTWGFGPMGVWWAITLTTFAKGAAQYLVFWHYFERWKRTLPARN